MLFYYSDKAYVILLLILLEKKRMINIRHSKIVSLLLILVLMLMLCSPVFAEDDENGGSDNNDITNQTDPSDTAVDPADTATPSIHTVSCAWDILRDDEGTEDSASYGSEKYAAEVFYYMDYEIDEEKEAEVDRLAEAADERDKAKAEKEAKQLAEELVANGRYKELIGEKNRYEKPWEDTFDYYEDDEEGADETADDEDGSDDTDDYYDDDETVHSGGPYYSTLKEKYPHILEFWFESDGKYYYDYDVDYSGIDFDSVYIEVPHDTFHVIDSVSYKDFAVQSKFSVKAQLVRLETNENGETVVKETVKELDTSLETGDATEGEFSLDFGELKLDIGNYVILINITDADGVEYLSHSDLNNKYESVQVSSLDADMDAAPKSNAKKNRGEGRIEFPSEVKSASPKTGDASRHVITFNILVILFSLIVCCRIAANRIKK